MDNTLAQETSGGNRITAVGAIAGSGAEEVRNAREFGHDAEVIEIMLPEFTRL